jgi:hypothetical protein
MPCLYDNERQSKDPAVPARSSTKGLASLAPSRAGRRTALATMRARIFLARCRVASADSFGVKLRSNRLAGCPSPLDGFLMPMDRISTPI